MTKTMQLEIVSAEKLLFQQPVQMLAATGTVGELGIYPGHTALMTTLKPGQVKVELEGGEQEFFYLSGGVMEVQPEVVTILADTAERASDLDEVAAQAAKEAAQKKLDEQQAGLEYSSALVEFSNAVAQLRAIEMLRRYRKK